MRSRRCSRAERSAPVERPYRACTRGEVRWACAGSARAPTRLERSLLRVGDLPLGGSEHTGAVLVRALIDLDLLGARLVSIGQRLANLLNTLIVLAGPRLATSHSAYARA